MLSRRCSNVFTLNAKLLNSALPFTSPSQNVPASIPLAHLIYLLSFANRVFANAEPQTLRPSPPLQPVMSRVTCRHLQSTRQLTVTSVALALPTPEREVLDRAIPTPASSRALRLPLQFHLQACRWPSPLVHQLLPALDTRLSLLKVSRFFINIRIHCIPSNVYARYHGRHVPQYFLEHLSEDSMKLDLS